MRYFLHLSYDGTNYKGWQRQTTAKKTIQESIEQSLRKVLKKQTTVYGCGRTDVGVHASQYFLHIDLEDALPPDFKFRLNKNLPDDIAIFDVLEVNEDQSARYHAVARTYDYFVHWKKDPVLFRHSSFYEHFELDFDLMHAAVALIRKTKDFKALCKRPDLYDHTLCQISEAKLFFNEEQGRLRFTITSNRFLRGMVRYCIFFLLEIGRGNISLEEFEAILTQKKNLFKKKPAFPNGLFLSRVQYPFLDLKNEHQLIRMLKVGLE
ncbi:MAG: tRNA pseudouridine(38-40) synthase TruA [Saprospiraceae bacterium]